MEFPIKIRNISAKRAVERMLRKKAKIAEQDKALDKYIRKIAKEALKDNKYFELQRSNGDIADFSANAMVQKYSSELDYVDNTVWAPWSKSFNTKK